MRSDIRYEMYAIECEAPQSFISHVVLPLGVIYHGV